MATVQSILSRKGSEVGTVGETQTVLEAAKQMNTRRVGCLVVVRDGLVTGIFTERDILTRIVAVGRDPGKTTVAEVMTSPVACCRPETTLDEITAAITQKRIRHLPVVCDNVLCGIVTSGDVLALQVKEHQDTIEYLSEYLYAPRR
ncbi:MAG TPA: CBS domain-containing protein [Planctomycetota bacterium]|jgi:CBS domain-containing protein